MWLPKLVCPSCGYTPSRLHPAAAPPTTAAALVRRSLATKIATNAKIATSGGSVTWEGTFPPLVAIFKASGQQTAPTVRNITRVSARQCAASNGQRELGGIAPRLPLVADAKCGCRTRLDEGARSPRWSGGVACGTRMAADRR